MKLYLYVETDLYDTYVYPPSDLVERKANIFIHSH